MSGAWRSAGRALLVLAFLGAAEGGADEPALGGADRRWLQEVAPLITAEESRLYAQLAPRDRERFREMFWARRDPDPSTPSNELRDDCDARRRLADRAFRQAGLRGALSDMARVFLLLGAPARVAQGRVGQRGAPEIEECGSCNVELESALVMMVGPTAGSGGVAHVTWDYLPEPGLGIPAGLSVTFRSLPGLGHQLVSSDELERALERARRIRIHDPARGYALDEAGRLLADAAGAGEEAALERALAAGGGAVAFRITPAFFEAGRGATYAPVVVEFEPAALRWRDGVAEATLWGRLDAGTAARDRFRARVALARDVDSRARLDLPLTLAPGRHELRLAVRDDVAGAWGGGVFELLVPDFHSGLPILSSVVVYASSEEAPPAPPAPGRAFQFGRLRLVPAGALRADQTLGVLFFVHGLVGCTDAVAQIALLRAGDPAARTPDQRLPVTEGRAVGSTEFPLASVAPGAYTLRVRVVDPAGGTTLARSVDFRVVAPKDDR